MEMKSTVGAIQMMNRIFAEFACLNRNSRKDPKNPKDELPNGAWTLLSMIV